MNGLTVLLLYLVSSFALAYRRACLRNVASVYGVLLLLHLIFGDGSWILTIVLLLSTVIPGLLSADEFRKERVSRPLLAWFKRVLPAISATEQEGIDAGTVWWEGDLFTGQPDWDKLLSTGQPRLTEEEQALIDGPLEQLCQMVDTWELNHESADIPVEVTAFIKKSGFLGMIIPRQFGGLELSAVAQSEVLTKLFGISTIVANYVVIPNSLGPAELLLKYGTDEQKEYYLPRLARGDEIPCFALTSPTAGSDATSITDTGIVCKGQWQGKEVTGMRLNFDKRYITLAPIATLVGLAFRLKDPDHLLGDTDDYGITCALIPRDTPGIELGNRHYPIGDPFINGPVRGKDIFVPLDTIIGGVDMAGKGWRMLVNCLSTGRAISLPSISNCMAKRCLMGSSAYARIRHQFNYSIAQFEGIQKPLARIAGLTYIINAARLHTAQAVAEGSKPSVPASILKYHCTEMARQIGLDSMDIHGGKAVMKGPKNYMSWGYESTPVAITVEGANIMTRSLMIFGQGATRCHPYVLKEMQITEKEVSDQTIADFDKLLFSHAGFACGNAARACVQALTGGLFSGLLIDSPVKHYYQQVNRLSAAFALITDVSMLTMQGSLKRREMISARLGDLLSMLYLISMVLKHYEDEACPAQDLPLVDWSCQTLLNAYQVAMHEILQNFPVRPCAWILRLLIFPVGQWFDKPSDKLDTRLTELVTHDTATRRRLLEGIYSTPGSSNPLGILNQVFLQSEAMVPLQKKLKDAIRAGRLQRQDEETLIRSAVEAEILDPEEASQLHEYNANVMDIINVDEFPYDTFARKIVPVKKTTVRKRSKKKTTTRKTTARKAAKKVKKTPG